MSDDNIIQLPLQMPPALASQVAVLSLPLNSEYADLPPLVAAPHPAASDWLRRKREMLRQACRQQCVDWLTMLGDGLNGVTEAMVGKRAAAVWMVCCDLPDLVWGPDTLRIMWKRSKYLATPGECHEVFTAYLAPLLAEIAALERIVAAKPPQVREPALPYVIPPAPEWVASRHVPREAVVLRDLPAVDTLPAAADNLLAKRVREIQERLASGRQTAG